MIALIALVACRDPADAEAPIVDEAAFAPSFGAWTTTLGQTWDGDCALEDKATHLPEEQTWVLADDRSGFAVRDEVGYRYACTLADVDFVCDLPDIEDDFSSIGYDVYATYLYSYVGAFDSEDQLSGVYRIDAACEGEDCDLLTGYGADFEFPCTAEAELRSALFAPEDDPVEDRGRDG